MAGLDESPMTLHQPPPRGLAHPSDKKLNQGTISKETINPGTGKNPPEAIPSTALLSDEKSNPNQRSEWACKKKKRWACKKKKRVSITNKK